MARTLGGRLASGSRSNRLARPILFRLRQLAPLLLSLLFAFALVVPLAADAVLPQRQRAAATLQPLSSVVILPAEPADAPGPVVGVGLHVRNIYALSLIDHSFLAEGWYWLEWGDEVQAILERRGLNPENIMELANEIELGQYSSREVAPASEGLIHRSKFGTTVRFSSKFYVNDVPQRFAPFDSQFLAISLEVKAEGLASGRDRIRFEPLHPAAQIVGEDVNLSGYDLDGVSWQPAQIVYPFDAMPDMRFSRLSAVFEFGRSDWAMFMKWIFPVLVVMIIVIVSPSIEGVLGDIRIAIPPSALLTLVVMQDTYKSSFPPAPYLTYLDELYVYSYIVCLAIFLLFLVGTNLVSRAKGQQRDAVATRVNRIDVAVQATLGAGFVLVAVVGWFT